MTTQSMLRAVNLRSGKSLVANESEKDLISEEAIRDELSRILESSMFVQSERLGRFLRFTVESALAGQGAQTARP